MVPARGASQHPPHDQRNHDHLLIWASVALYALLTSGWLIAATGTLHGSLRGRSFLPTPTPVVAAV